MELEYSPNDLIARLNLWDKIGTPSSERIRSNVTRTERIEQFRDAAILSSLDPWFFLAQLKVMQVHVLAGEVEEYLARFPSTSQHEQNLFAGANSDGKVSPVATRRISNSRRNFELTFEKYFAACPKSFAYVRVLQMVITH